MKSDDYIAGMTAALCFVSDVFELHSDAFVKKGYFRKKDLTLILNIIDACIRRREVLADVGARGVNLFVGKNRTVSLKEK